MASEEDLLGYKDYEDLPELDPGEEDDLLALDDDDDLGQKQDSGEFVEYELQEPTEQNASLYGSQEEEDVLDLAIDGDLEIEDNDAKAIEDNDVKDVLKNESSDSEDEAASGRGRFKSERTPNVVSVTSAKKRPDIPDTLDFVDIHEDAAKAEDFVKSDKFRNRGRGRGGNRNYRGGRDQRMNRTPGVSHRRFLIQQRPTFPFSPVVNFPGNPYHQLPLNQLRGSLDLRLQMPAPVLQQQHPVKPSSNVHINPHFRGTAPQRSEAPKMWEDTRLTSPSVIQNLHPAQYQQINTTEAQHNQQFASQQSNVGPFQNNRTFSNEVPTGYSDQGPSSNFQAGQMSNSQTFYQDKQQFSSDGPYHQFETGANRESYTQPSQDVNRIASYVDRPSMNPQESWPQQPNQISSIFGRVPTSAPNTGNFNSNVQPQQQYLPVWQNQSVSQAFTNQPPPSQHIYTPNQVPNMSFNPQTLRPGVQHHLQQQQQHQHQHQNHHKQQPFRQRQQRGRQQQQQQQQKQHHPHAGQPQFPFKPEISSWQQPDMMTEKMFQSFSKSAGNVLTVIEPLPEHQFNALNKLQLKQKRQQRFQGVQSIGATSTAGNKKRPSDEFLGLPLKKLKGLKMSIQKRVQNKNIKEIQIVESLPPAANEEQGDPASDVLAVLNAPVEKATLPIEDEKDEETRNLRLLIEEQNRIREKVMRQKEANRRKAAEQRRRQENIPSKTEIDAESSFTPLLSGVNQNKDLDTEAQNQDAQKVSVKERLFLSKDVGLQQKGKVENLNTNQELNVTQHSTQQAQIASQGNQIRPVLATNQVRKRIVCTSQTNEVEIDAKRPALGRGIRGRLGVRKGSISTAGAVNTPEMQLKQCPSDSSLANQENSPVKSVSVSVGSEPPRQLIGSVISRGRARGRGRGRVIRGRGLLRGISETNRNVFAEAPESPGTKNSTIAMEHTSEEKSGKTLQEETLRERNNISPITAPSPSPLPKPKQISRTVIRGPSVTQSRPIAPSEKQSGVAPQKQVKVTSALRPQTPATQTITGLRQRTPITHQQQSVTIRPQVPGTQQRAPNVLQQSPVVRQLVPVVRQQAPGVRHQTPGVRQQSAGLRQQTPGVRQQAPGIRQQAPSVRQQTTNLRHQVPTVRQLVPTGAQQFRGTARQQSSSGMRQPSPGNVRQLSSGVVRQQSPGVMRQQSPGVVRQQSPGVVRQQSPGVVRQQSPGVVRPQSSGAVRQQSPATARQQSPAMVRHQSPGAARQQSPGAARQQPPGAVRQQPPGLVRQQSPGAVRQQSPGAVRQQSIGLRQQSPSFRQPAPVTRQPATGIHQSVSGPRQQSPGVRQPNPNVRHSSPAIRLQAPSMRQQVPSAQSIMSPPSRPSGDQKSSQVVSASPSKLALVENLAAATSKEQLLKMCQGIGAVESIEHSKPERKAVVKFMNSVHAEQFMKKYQRRMVDLSLINVSLLSS